MTNAWIKKQTCKWFVMAAIATPVLSHPTQAENATPADPVIVTVRASQPKNISPYLFGIFFEDLNYAADGGLYAELVQNRSFEYSPRRQQKLEFADRVGTGAELRKRFVDSGNKL